MAYNSWFINAPCLRFEQLLIIIGQTEQILHSDLSQMAEKRHTWFSLNVQCETSAFVVLKTISHITVQTAVINLLRLRVWPLKRPVCNVTLA